MKYALAVPTGVAIGLAAAFVLPASLVVVAVALAVLVLLVAWVLYCRRGRRRAPDGYRTYVAEHLDAGAGPPPAAEPVDEPVVERWFAAGARDDWRAAADLLAPGFRYLAPGRRRPRWVMVRVLRNGGRVLRTDTLAHTAYADPGEPDVVWVHEDSVTRSPRGGAEIRTAVWHRWTLTPDRRQVRAFELVAYVEPLVPA